MARVIWPFLVPLLVSLLIVTLLPEISTWLPNVMFKK
jgi:TRAP-type C4-dicarboxylate transport system permease large subunit